MSYEISRENEDHLSVISKHTKDWSESQSFTNNTFLGNFISTGSLSESSSLDISGYEQDSIVIKNVYQDYDGILEVLEESYKKITDIDRASLAVTTAKGSLIEEAKKQRKLSKEDLHANAFAVPGRFYCKECLSETMSIIKYKPLTIGFWNSLYSLVHSNKCCIEKVNFPDIIHECPICHAVLARITSA